MCLFISFYDVLTLSCILFPLKAIMMMVCSTHLTLFFHLQQPVKTVCIRNQLKHILKLGEYVTILGVQNQYNTTTSMTGNGHDLVKYVVDIFGQFLLFVVCVHISMLSEPTNGDDLLFYIKIYQLAMKMRIGSTNLKIFRCALY